MPKSLECDRMDWNLDGFITILSIDIRRARGRMQVERGCDYNHGGLHLSYIDGINKTRYMTT
jgi:hypothetical protein